MMKMSALLNLQAFDLRLIDFQFDSCFFFFFHIIIILLSVLLRFVEYIAKTIRMPQIVL